jgi:hypothetical protein
VISELSKLNFGLINSRAGRTGIENLPLLQPSFGLIWAGFVSFAYYTRIKQEESGCVYAHLGHPHTYLGQQTRPLPLNQADDAESGRFNAIA